MKKYFYKLACIFALFAAYMPLNAQQQADGTTCSKAIPLGKDYTASVKKGQEVWYTAWTFDLPLTVTFAPDKGKGEPAPVVEMDFSCINGYYTDSILCSLFCKTSGSGGIDYGLPHSPALNSTTLEDGTFVYYLSLGKKYRDMLLQVGISYNLKVYVRVIYKCDGIISMAPDNLFTNCVDNAKFIRIGDTVQVKAEDKQRHVVFPYLQWQEDTILYKWEGETPCTMVVSNTCEFDPTADAGEHTLEKQVIQPGGELKETADLIYEYVHNQKDFPNDAGMYFAKFYSEKPGVLTVKKMPQPQPDGKATLLRFNMTYPLDALTQDVYAIPRSWNVDIRLTTPTSHMFSMIFSSTASFGPNDTLGVYAYEKTDAGRQLGIKADDMKAMWNKIPASRHYIYIRFVCTEATTITPKRWSVSDCYSKRKDNAVVPGQSITIVRTSSVVYCFSYSQWKGGDMTITYPLTSNCELYFADTCTMTRTKSDAPYWLKYKAIVKNNQPVTITADEIASWADKIDEEGIFYGLFYSTATSTNRTLTFTTNAPEDEDPVYPAVTIAVVCEAEKTQVKVSAEQDMTVIDALGQTVDSWHAVPGTPHELILGAGAYTVCGAEECVHIVPMTIPAEILSAKTQSAGIAPDKATHITGMSKLAVQSGGNFLRIEPDILPAMVIYLPDTAFGPVPSLSIAGETQASRAVFSDCYQGWAWQLQQGETAQIAEIRAHENATVFVVPENTPVPECDDTDTTAVVTGSIEWYGKTYTKNGDYSITKVTDDGCEYTHTLHLTVSSLPHVTETKQGCGTVEVDGTVYTASTTLTDTVDIDGQQTVRTLVINVNHATTGELKIHECSAYTAPWGETYAQSGNYTYTTKNVAGCDSLITLNLTIDDCDATYDTVYFCAGQNTEHDETVGLGRIMRYLPYVYESPAAWGGYMDGVIIQSELTRTLVDLNRAERNLYEHYKDELTPVRSVSWSLRPDGQSEYRPVVVENVPQWVEAGVLAMTVRFLCGEMYTANFATDITNTGAVSIPCKVLENGQVIIIRGGKKYTVFGQRVD